MSDGDAERRREILDAFDAALDEPIEARARWLAHRFPGDAATVAAVEALLAADAAPTLLPSTLDPDAELIPPERVGAYRLVERIGSGGMGEVWRAERADGLFDHHVAIKLMRPSLVSPELETFFDSERRLLARLRHPHIARLFDGGVAERGVGWFAMDLVEGIALDAWVTALPPVASARADAERRVAMAAAIARAIQHAHQHLIVHADLKPQNILVEADDTPRLVDFGIAHLVAGVDDPAIERTYPRTPAYASPERLAGAPPSVADDVFALGTLLHGLLTGTWLTGAYQAVAPPSTAVSRPLAKVLRGDLDAIFLRARSPAHGDRYATADALAADLERWMIRKPVKARSATWRYVTARFVMRHRRGLAVTLVVLAAMAGLITAAVIGWRAAERRRTLVELRTSDLQQLARYQLAVLTPQLEHQPRSTRVRRDLAREAEDVLARAAAGGGASPALRRDAAEGYRLLARVEGAPDRPSLGRPELAEKALIRAEALLANDGAADGRRLLARVLIDQATIAGAAGDADRALRLLTRARQLAVGAGSALTDDIALLRADTFIWDGNYGQARAIAKAIVPRHRTPPSDVEEALRQDRVLDRQAEASFYLGDEREAAMLYAQAAEALTAALVRWPADGALEWALARQQWNLGTTLISLGRPDEALPLLRTATAAVARIAADDPDDMVAARRLRSYEMATAQGLAATGRTTQAARLLAANIAARQRWAEASPGDTARQRDVAIAVAALGDIHAAAGQRAAACARYAEVHRLHAALAHRHRLSKLDSHYFAGLIQASERRLACPAA